MKRSLGQKYHASGPLRYQDRTELASYSKRTKCDVVVIEVSGGGICEEADMTGAATATRFGVFYLLSSCH
jgi:hypothetical protein